MKRFKLLILITVVTLLLFVAFLIAQQRANILLMMPRQKQNIGTLSHTSQGKIVLNASVSGRCRIQFQPDSITGNATTNHVICRLANINVAKLKCIFDKLPPASQHEEFLKANSSVVVFDGDVGEMLGMKSPLIMNLGNSGNIALEFDFQKEITLPQEVSVWLMEETMLP